VSKNIIFKEKSWLAGQFKRSWLNLKKTPAQNRLNAVLVAHEPGRNQPFRPGTK